MHVFKGNPAVQLVKSCPQYNAETKVTTFVYEYEGSEAAVRGLESQLRSAGWSYRTDHNGPVWRLYVEQPEQTIDDDLDRWEIFTESTEKSLFELPDIVLDAQIYDAGLSDGETTFREACEAAVRTKATAIEAEPSAVDIINHLRSGVTGWQLDLIGLRRTRKMDLATGVNYQLTLDTGLLLYTTAQLNLPSAVQFGVPATPNAISDLYLWRWRKRSQRVEIVGQFVEQTVELLFAPWSTLAYSDAGGSLSW